MSPSPIAVLRGCFVTGTDTEIGKTCVSGGLVHAFRRQGLRAAAIKPLAAGQQQDAEGRWFNDDVRHLHGAQDLGLSEAEVGPFQWRTACAPHIAAAIEGRPIDPAAVRAAIHRLAARTEALVVEGVGGFRVPLVPGWDTADMAVDLALPVVLVVGLRLGCINHALLTARAILADGLPLAGWVANQIDPEMAFVQDNIDAIAQRLPAPCLGHVPALHGVDMPARVAQASAHLALDRLPGLAPTPGG